ncbi:hypothetical protein D3C75_841420 [compost metagenome]
MTPTSTGERIAAIAVLLYDQAISPGVKPSLLRYCHRGTNHAPQINHSINIITDSFR